MITGKKQPIKKIKPSSMDTIAILSIGGIGAGVGIGRIMTDLKEMKTDSPLSNIHHWVAGLFLGLIGVFAGIFGYVKNAAMFLTAVGFGIMLTDLKDMGKQLDNLRDQEPITEGVDNPPYNEYGSEYIDINEI